MNPLNSDGGRRDFGACNPGKAGIEQWFEATVRAPDGEVIATGEIFLGDALTLGCFALELPTPDRPVKVDSRTFEEVTAEVSGEFYRLKD
jgi:hypothetical protein